MREFEHKNMLVVDESTQYVYRKRVELHEPVSQRAFGLYAAAWEGAGWHVERTRWQLRDGKLQVTAAWCVKPAESRAA